MNLNKEPYYKMYVGDCRKILKTFPDEKFQLMVTSPPYWGVRDYKHPKQIGFGQSLDEYLKELKKVWKEVVRLLLPDGKVAVNIGNIYYSELDEKRKTTANLALLIWNQFNSFKELRFMGTIYWQKKTSRNGTVLFGSYPYPSNFMVSNAVEIIYIFRKKGKRKISKRIKELSKITKEEFREYRNAIWSIHGHGNSGNNHPATFPPELPKRLIKMYSFAGDEILDPFCGIGTSNIEALKLNRSSVGIDTNPLYIKEALLKLKRLKGKIKSMSDKNSQNIEISSKDTAENEFIDKCIEAFEKEVYEKKLNILIWGLTEPADDSDTYKVDTYKKEWTLENI